MRTYLNEELIMKKKKVCESSYATLPVLLRSHNREWVVYLGGRNLQKGWPKFVDQYFDDDDDAMKMDVGDIIVFRHKGNLIFDVSVFDATTSCQKLPNHHSINTQDQDQDQDHQSPLINNSKKKKKKKIISSGPNQNQNEDDDDEDEVECSKAYNRKKRTAAETSVCPYFDSEIKLNTNIEKKILYLPTGFVKESGLERICKMRLEDDRGRRWEVEAKYYNTRSCVYITKGWNEFRIGNGLELKDCFRFQLIKNTGIPLLLFTRLPKKDGDNTRKKRRRTANEEEKKKMKNNF